MCFVLRRRYAQRFTTARLQLCRFWRSKRPKNFHGAIHQFLPEVNGGGIQIEGFDFGNSPFEYTEERVSGRTIAFTTTNGTKAMNQCKQSSNVFIGSFCNFSEITRSIAEHPKIDLICAGTNGEITLEDCIFAGMVAENLSSESVVNFNDQAEICRKIWTSSKSDLQGALKQSTGGRNLIHLKKEADVELASRIDSIPILPKLNTNTWNIKPA